MTTVAAGASESASNGDPIFLASSKLETRINTPLDSVLLPAGMPLEVFDDHSVLSTTYVPGAYLEVLTLGGGAGAAPLAVGVVRVMIGKRRDDGTFEQGEAGRG